jgi:cytochrome P450
MLADPLAFIQTQQQQYGSVVGMLLGGEWVVLVSSPDVAQQVLIDQPDVFVKEGTAFFPGSSLTGNGLLVSDGDVWKRQRRLSNPAFRKAAVDAYAEQMVVCTQQLLNGSFAAAAGEGDGEAGAPGWVQTPTRDVYADYNELTLNITLAALFGISSTGHAGHVTRSTGGVGTTTPTTYSSSSSAQVAAGSVSTTDSGSDARMIVESVEKAFTYFTNRGAAALALPEWVPLPDNVEFVAAVKQLDDVVYYIIATRRTELLAQAGMTGSGSSSHSDALKTSSSVSSQGQGEAGSRAGSSFDATTTTSTSSSSSTYRSQSAPESHDPRPFSSAASSSRSSSSASQGSSSSVNGNARVRKDLLQALLDSKDESGQGMSDVALRDELMTLLVAGQETSAILLGWTTALLAYHPQVQQAAAEEVQQVR